MRRTSVFHPKLVAFLLFLLLGSRAPVLAEETATPTAGAYLSYGQDLLNQGKASEAKPYFEYALNLDSGLWQAWKGLGQGAAQDKRWDEAVTDYENALKVNPSEPEIPALIRDIKLRQTPYHFAEDPGQALNSSRKSRIPMLLLFSAEAKRCPRCAAYTKLILESEELRPLLHSYAGGLVDAVWSEGKASFYGVEKVPCLVLVSPSGKVVGRLEGEQSVEALLGFFRGFQAKR